MSQSKKIRRNQQKGLRAPRGKSDQFKAAMTDLSKKLQALQGVDLLPEVLGNLEMAVHKAETLAVGLTEDYNTLLRRIERLEEKTGFHYSEEPVDEGA